MTRTKKLIRKAHLWMGLGSGLIVTFLGITGCMLAFQQEIENKTQGCRYIQPQQTAILPPSKLQSIAQQQLPGKQIHAVKFNGKALAAEVIFYSLLPEENYYYIIFIDPYTGQVQKVKNMNLDFFRIVVDGHYYLWLPPNIGQPIVASATLIFLLLMISGIVLWWPRNRHVRKQRFAIRFNARWRRVNYGLHNAAGFYMTWAGIFLAVTGLVFGFEWFAKGLHTITGGKSSITYLEPSSDTTKRSALTGEPIDLIFGRMMREYSQAEYIEVHPPPDKASPIAANANPDRETYWKTDYRYFDQYTLKELPVSHIYGKLNDANMGDKLLRMNYDIHTGAVIGITGKTLMFFASLIISTLPVTGFIIWRGRKKKRKTPAGGKTTEPSVRKPLASLNG